MYSNKNIIKISTPILLSLMAQNIIQMIDTAFLGHVGEVELGASALAGIIYIAIYTLGFGFSMGAQILIGRRNGEQRYSQIGYIVVQGIMFLFIPALLIIALFKTTEVDLLRTLFSSNDVGYAVSQYLDWRVYGIVFAFINTMFRAFYVGIERTKVLTLNAIVMASVNVVLDYALIFGHWGMPQMGIGGAALASVISEAASMIFFVIFTLKTVNLQKYGFRKIKFHWGVIKSILNISIFMMIQYLFSIVTWLMFLVFIENYMGERQLAITNIIISLYTITTIPSNALATAINTMVSNTIGAKQKDKVLPLVKRVALLTIYAMSIMIALLLLFPKAFILIYTNDAELINQTIKPLYVLATILPIYGVGTVLYSAVSGTGNTRTALFFEISTLLVYILYSWFIIVHLRCSVAVAWTTEGVYWGGLLLFSLYYLKRGKWYKKEI